MDKVKPFSTRKTVRVFAKGLFFGVASSLLSILGEVSLFSETSNAFTATLIFRALANIVLIAGVLAIALEVFNISIETETE